jgi:GTP-binding protein
VNFYKETLLNGLWEEMPPYFVTSSSNKDGRDELLAYIDGINENMANDR